MSLGYKAMLGSHVQTNKSLTYKVEEKPLQKRKYINKHVQVKEGKEDDSMQAPTTTSITNVQSIFSNEIFREIMYPL